MAVYSYAQLESLWIGAGGSRTLAPLMAAIAEAESGGNSDAHNPSGAAGLWQILDLPFAGNPFDPAVNAQMAVAKYKSQGLGAWVTYTSGAYKAFLQNSTTPDPNVPGSPTANATLTAKDAALLAAAAQADCLWSIAIPGESQASGWIGDINNFFQGLYGMKKNAPNPTPQICLLSKSHARGVVGVGLLVAGGLIMLPGIILLAGAAGAPIEQAVKPAAQTLAKVTPAGRAASAGTKLERATRPGQRASQSEVKRAQSNRATLDRARRREDRQGATDA